MRINKRVLDDLPKLMEDPVFKASWDALEPEFALAATLIEARIKSGMTQAQIAEKMGVSLPILPGWNREKMFL